MVNSVRDFQSGDITLETLIRHLRSENFNEETILRIALEALDTTDVDWDQLSTCNHLLNNKITLNPIKNKYLEEFLESKTELLLPNESFLTKSSFNKDFENSFEIHKNTSFLSHYLLSDPIQNHQNINIYDFLQQNITPIHLHQYLSEDNLESTIFRVAVGDTGGSSSTQRDEAIRMQVSLKELEEQPEKVLHDLDAQLKAKPSAKFLVVKFLREDGSLVDGIDAGGPARAFLNRLFEGVITRSSLTFKQESGGALPVVTNQADLDKYQAMGRVMKFCLNQSDYLIGSHFDQSFFDALAAGNGSTLDIYRALNQNNPTITKMFQFLEAEELPEEALMYAYPDGDQPDIATHSVVKQRIHQTLMDYANADQTIPAIQCIAKELNTQKDGATLKKAIQGEISKELLIERVNCPIPLREHFMQWVNEASPQLIERFIEVVTGSKTLGTRRITLVNNKETPETLPTFHTCGQVVRMPIYPSFDHFKAKLEYALEGALGDGGFQFA